jgi:hypothetical protein
MPDYLSTVEFGSRLESTLNAFHRALTRRWREQAAEAIMHNRPLPMMPQPSGDYQQRHLGPEWFAPAWSYSSLEARAHVDPGACQFLAWVHGGQQRPLEHVRCDGITEPVWISPETGQYVPVGPTIDCGVGRVLRQVEDWAWAERTSVRSRLPALDHHDLSALHAAFDDLATIADRLDVDRGGRDVLDGGQPARAGDLPEVVTGIFGSIGAGKGWRIDWTGLAAERAASFLDSTRPTMSNQCQIAKAMAKLCSDRGAIIEKGRRDTLAWLNWAVTCLDQTEEVTNGSAGWVAVQAIGQGVAAAGAANPKVAAAGGIIALIGFLGDNLTPDTREVAHLNQVAEVLAGLHQGIDQLHTELDSHEREYWRAVTKLRDWIHGAQSYNLELYDLTRNNPTGSGQGFSVDVDDVLWLATRCHRMGSGYEELRPILARTSDAERHLAGPGGGPTSADSTLLEIRDLFESFLRTTAARYHIAADQLESAARAYAATDADVQQRLDEVLQQGHDPVPPVNADHEQDAVATGRRPRSYVHAILSGDHDPERAGLYREPGWADPNPGYVTEDE